MRSGTIFTNTGRRRSRVRRTRNGILKIVDGEGTGRRYTTVAFCVAYVFSVADSRELGDQAHIGHVPDVQTRAQGRRGAEGQRRGGHVLAGRVHRTGPEAADADQHGHVGPEQPVPVDIPRAEQIVSRTDIVLNARQNVNMNIYTYIIYICI